MGGCFGGRKLTKKPRNRRTKLGGMLQIYSIHRPGRRPQGGHGPKIGQSTMEKAEGTQLHSFNLALEGG
jgi:hypothetical protein